MEIPEQLELNEKLRKSTLYEYLATPFEISMAKYPDAPDDCDDRNVAQYWEVDDIVGTVVGRDEGFDGDDDGETVGTATDDDGDTVGDTLGLLLDNCDGDTVGETLGDTVGDDVKFPNAPLHADVSLVDSFAHKIRASVDAQ